MWAQISWPLVLIGAVCQTLVISAARLCFAFPPWIVCVCGLKSGGWLLGMDGWMHGRVGGWRRFCMVSLYVSEGLKTGCKPGMVLVVIVLDVLLLF